MVSGSLGRSSSVRSTSRTSGINSPRYLSSFSFSNRKWIPFAAAAPSLMPIATTFFLSALLLALACAIYLYALRGTFFTGFVSAPAEQCDVFSGNWVPDDTYPLYNSSECPFSERGFNCLANGRKDTDYLKWRWKPSTCNLPRFDARAALEGLRGKRVVFVGDSMSRTQWESMICMLMTAVDDKNSVYEVNGNRISKTIRFLGVRFGGYNLTVEFFRSVFLVQRGLPPKHGPKRVKAVLKLDKLDDISHRWVDSDVLIFNSGHWWTASKLFDLGCYFQDGVSLKLGMPITSAFKMALETWAFWVEKMVNTNRTHVFFRTFEPSHWSSSDKKVCDMTQQPTSEAKGDDRSEFGDILAEVIGNMSVAVNVLNVTLMGAFRSDAHIGPWSHPLAIFDCSHWCLPGVPDAWNELVFSYLLANAKWACEQVKSKESGCCSTDTNSRMDAGAKAFLSAVCWANRGGYNVQRSLVSCTELWKAINGQENELDWRTNPSVIELRQILTDGGQYSMDYIPWRWNSMATYLAGHGINLVDISLFHRGMERPRWLMRMVEMNGFYF